jgi:hypothetical protein
MAETTQRHQAVQAAVVRGFCLVAQHQQEELALRGREMLVVTELATT